QTPYARVERASGSTAAKSQTSYGAWESPRLIGDQGLSSQTADRFAGIGIVKIILGGAGNLHALNGGEERNGALYAHLFNARIGGEGGVFCPPPPPFDTVHHC